MGGRGRKSERVRDVRAALAANLVNGAAERASAGGEQQQFLEARAERPTRLGELQRVGRFAAKRAPILLPRAALGRLVVAAEHLEHAFGVRRTARVLQQQRVEQILLILRRKPDDAPERHPDEARTRRMPAQMTLGEIEGIRERGQNGADAEGGVFFSHRGHRVKTKVTSRKSDHEDTKTRRHEDTKTYDVNSVSPISSRLDGGFDCAGLRSKPDGVRTTAKT